MNTTRAQSREALPERDRRHKPDYDPLLSFHGKGNPKLVYIMQTPVRTTYATET
jgi:hypothetical protein